MQQPSPSRVAAAARRVDRSAGRLATVAMRRMEETLPWFAAMPPEHRSQVGLLLQVGLRGLGHWLTSPDTGPRITAEVFATAPSELARVVSLEQTVELVRIAVQVAEDSVGELAPDSEQTWLREAALRYSREIAFAAALVYAQAAELRGAWDARLEALVVDAVVRGDVSDSLLSRASALGWSQRAQVSVLAGRAPDGDPERVLGDVRRLGRDAAADVLAGVHTARLVVILGVDRHMARVSKALLPAFAPGPVVSGPVVGGLTAAVTSVQDAFAGLRAAPAWPAAPRPVPSAALLPERALSGDARAGRALITDVYLPIAADANLLRTADAYLVTGGAVEATARELFVHANTVRYRLRRIAELAGHDLTDSRDRYVIQVALALGRLDVARAVL